MDYWTGFALIVLVVFYLVLLAAWFGLKRRVDDLYCRQREFVADFQFRSLREEVREQRWVFEALVDYLGLQRKDTQPQRAFVRRQDSHQ